LSSALRRREHRLRRRRFADVSIAFVVGAPARASPLSIIVGASAVFVDLSSALVG